jgi:NAD(P)H-quinone oxidoreductase subunit 5
VHGWLIQVMEAPTPISALLHAGVVNLGGVVLIRFAPLLEQAPLARGLLVVAGLATALLAGLVMLTRISIKVRLAWSTVAQMGFMLMECGLGLYTLAALHLIGHSLYKAHAFLSASEAVREARLRALRPSQQASAASLWLAPLLSAALVGGLALALQPAAWPWWWSCVLALAWAPMLWWSDREPALTRLAAALPMLAGLALAALLLHGLPLGLQDRPFEALGPLVLTGMAGLYLGLALLQCRPEGLSGWRRWSYAGFYLDEVYTRLTLRLWPTRWTPAQAPHWRGASTSLATRQP